MDSLSDFMDLVQAALELTFDDIKNVPVASAASVTDWNTLFHLPANGTPFTSVVIDVNTIKLYGCDSMDLNNNQLYGDFELRDHLISFIDNANCIKNVLGAVFSIGAGAWLLNLHIVRLPSCLSIIDDGFIYITTLIDLYLPSCTDMGTSVGDNAIFNFITGDTITLTIPSALMTCNGGNPDGDIQYLVANNTVTIVTV